MRAIIFSVIIFSVSMTSFSMQHDECPKLNVDARENVSKKYDWGQLNSSEGKEPKGTTAVKSN